MVNTNLVQIHSVRAQSLLALMGQMKNPASRPRLFDGFHSIEATDKAMLVDPVNGAPYVFVPPAACYEFVCEPRNSGTEHLRARIHAKLFFDAMSTDTSSKRVAS